MEAFIARQPIFDRKRRVMAYELLFRDGLGHGLSLANGTEATSQVMGISALLFGTEGLTGGKKAFINVTREVLVKEYVRLFSGDRMVPEIVGDVSEDLEAVTACRKLKETGYQIALDSDGPVRHGPITEMADLIKVDFAGTKVTEQQAVAARFKNTRVHLVAKKIETYEMFTRAMDMGYDHFQGFFFAKPETLSTKDIPANKLKCMELLRRIHDPEISFDQLDNTIRQDVALSYRLLRYLNSVSFGLRSEVSSIRHALTMLGEREIKKWVTLISMMSMGELKPSELLTTSLARARFCERLAAFAEMNDKRAELFLVGLLSTLDAVVDWPLTDCLNGLPIAKHIKEALLGTPGCYREILDVALDYEKSDWECLLSSLKKIGVRPSVVPDVYLDAIRWSREACGAGMSKVVAH